MIVLRMRSIFIRRINQSKGEIVIKPEIKV